VALALTALLSVVALAIDVGMLLTSRSEAQRAADAAAMAGAGSLIGEPDDAQRAEDFAIQFGESNNVSDQLASILPVDVDVDLGNKRVTVRVRRQADRGNAVDTWFANVFGVSEADVGAVASAQVGAAGSAKCLKPWAVPDAWEDLDDDGEYDVGEFYRADSTGWGTEFRNAGEPGNGQFDLEGLGPYENDRGRLIEMKAGSPDDAVVSGWFFPWDIPQPDGGPDTGGARYRDNIINCNPSIITLGQEYMVENGNMIGPTKQGVNELISQDPGASWSFACDCVTGSNAPGGWEGSPRVAIVPLYDPTTPVEPGKKPIVFNNFANVFLEQMQGNTVVARFLGYSTGVGGGAPGPTLPHLQFVQIVE
jgi:hypothetical protein